MSAQIHHDQALLSLATVTEAWVAAWDRAAAAAAALDPAGATDGGPVAAAVADRIAVQLRSLAQRCPGARQMFALTLTPQGQAHRLAPAEE